MNKRLRALLERRTKALAAAKGITATAEQDDDRDLTEDERTAFDGHMASVEALDKDIEREKKVIEAERNAEGLELDDDPTITGGTQASEADPRGGFNSLGEFLTTLVRVGQDRGTTDPRLQRNAAALGNTYGNEGTGSDGGYLVPPEFSREVFRHALEEDSLLPMTDNNQVSGNSMVFPKSEVTPWGASGMRAYWEAEAAEATKSKPNVGTTTLRLHKLFGVVPLTDELLTDAPALGSFVQSELAANINWKFNDAFYDGDGVGKPLGVLNANALVSVPKETGQAADSLVVQNIANMYARMPARALQRAVWMINSDLLPFLITMKLGDQPIYQPPGGLPNAPAGALLGRPIRITEHCKTAGDRGDIAFVDWMHYRTITKAQGIETATSMHLYFDSGATAFRAIYRVDGQPKIEQPITPPNSTNQKSPFVFLDERA